MIQVKPACPFLHFSCSFPGCAQVFKNASKMRHHQKVHSGKGKCFLFCYLNLLYTNQREIKIQGMLVTAIKIICISETLSEIYSTIIFKSPSICKCYLPNKIILVQNNTTKEAMGKNMQT